MATSSWSRAKPRRRWVPFAVVTVLVSVAAFIWWPGDDGDDGPAPSLRSEKAAESGGGGAEVPQKTAPGPEPQVGRTEQQETPAVSARRRAEKAIESAAAEGGEAAVRKVLGRLALDESLPARYRNDLFRRADALNRRLVFSKTSTSGFRELTVAAGDSYWKICRRLSKEGLSVSAGLLETVNGIGPHRLRPGQVLKVPEEEVSLLVDKSEYRLYLLLGGAYLLRFPIGIGRDGLTPEGEFEIRGKTREPPWTDPRSGKVYKYGQKGHVIGSRWLGFHAGGQPTGFGVHGTVEPESVGAAVSDGCIRLRNEDAEKLFELVSEGTRVVVRA